MSISTLAEVGRGKVELPKHAGLQLAQKSVLLAVCALSTREDWEWGQRALQLGLCPVLGSEIPLLSPHSQQKRCQLLYCPCRDMTGV